MNKREVIPKRKKSRRLFLPKAINLLLKEEKSQVWEKVKKIANTTALSLSFVSLLAALFTLSYFWFLSSYGASLEKRTDQAKAKISSLKREEQTYLSLIKKIENAEKILSVRGSVSQFLRQVDLLLPSEIAPHSLSVKKNGEISLTLSSSSLSEIENLNENLKKAINEGKILSAEIGSVIKGEESLYKLSLKFKMTSLSED